MAEYLPPEAIKAQQKLVELTRELGREVTPADVRERRKIDDSIPDPNQYAWWHGIFEEAAKKAYREYLRELPDDEDEEDEEEDNKEEATEVESEKEPEEDSEQYPDTSDPFDGDPAPILESRLPVHEINLSNDEDEQPEPQEEIEHEGDEIVKLYNSEHMSKPARPPKVSLINYLFDCRVRVIDSRFNDGRFFYAEDTGFYATTSEREVTTSKIDYLTDSLDEEIPNQFVVERTNCAFKLVITSHERGVPLVIPFPGPCDDTVYIVSRSFAEAAREAGRTTNDLIFAKDYEKVNDGNHPEIIVTLFGGL
ncbi:hypothetical protein IK110_03555 [Candidatus Saccharibacteria bacterium]|nr:hypothetical protein [Candidatus Saccharibacteria bacterium]